MSAPPVDIVAMPELGLIDRIKWTTFARTVALTGLLVLTISMDLGLGPKPISQPPEVLLYQFETAFFVLTFLALLFTYLLPPRRLVAVAWGSMAIDLALACVLVAMTDRTQSVFIFAMPLAVCPLPPFWSAKALSSRRPWRRSCSALSP